MSININLPPKATRPRSVLRPIQTFIRPQPQARPSPSPLKPVPEEHLISEIPSFCDFPTGVADFEEEPSFLPLELVSFGSFCTLGIEEDAKIPR